MKKIIKDLNNAINFKHLHSILGLTIFVISLCINACGNSSAPSHDNTSVIFSIKWQGGIAKTSGMMQKPDSVDCASTGVSKIEANIYDSSNKLLAGGGPWNCDSHSGAITGSLAGTNRKIIVTGKDSDGNILYRGERTGVTITNGQTTDIGTITVSYVEILPAPTGVAAIGVDGKVTITWDSVSNATGYNIYMDTDTGVSKTTYEESQTSESASFTWTGLENNTTYYFVVTCEDGNGESSESQEVAAMPKVLQIPTDAILNPDNEHSYKRIDIEIKWSEAKAYCENLGGYLATLTSKEEDRFVYNNLISSSDHFSWLGGTDETADGVWQWITGETWNFTNWCSGEPNNKRSENYLEIYNSGCWNDIGNNNNNRWPKYFICEWSSYPDEGSGGETSVIPTDGLIAYYPFNGNANDESGNGNHGTVNGATLTADRFGKAYSAYSFDGQSNEIKLPFLQYSGNNYTWVLWMNLSEIDDNYRTIFMIPKILYLYLKNTSLKIYGTETSSGGERTVNSVLSQNKWIHLSFNYFNGTLSVYKNSKYFGSVTINVNTNVNNAFVGSASGIQYFFKGFIDDIRIYNRDLSESEIQAIYNEGNGNKNTAPVANAGPDKNVTTSSTVALYGSGSSDEDGDTLTYSWLITSSPTGSSASFSDSTIVDPTFTADVDGTYVINLVVNDGIVDSEPDIVLATASPDILPNTAPIANAGSNQNVITGSIVTLDGSESTDVDVDTLSYSWSFTSKPDGSYATLSNAVIMNPTFTTDIDGEYIIRLVVNDGKEDSEADVLVIIASQDKINNQLSLYFTDAYYYSGSIYKLQDGQISTQYSRSGRIYSLAIDFNGIIYFSNANDPNIYKLVNDVETIIYTHNTYSRDVEFDLTGKLYFSESSGAGSDGFIYRLEGNEAILYYRVLLSEVGYWGGNFAFDTNNNLWLSHGNKISASLFKVNNGNAQSMFTSKKESIAGFFFEPNGNLIYADWRNKIYRLTIPQYIQNEFYDSSSAKWLSDVIPIMLYNYAPVADAGPNQRVMTNSEVVLDASNSGDTEGNTLIYSWSIISMPEGSNTALHDGNIVNPAFTVDVDGEYMISLVVNNGVKSSTKDIVTIVATIDNSVPVANAGPDQKITTGSKAKLDGNGSSDVDGDTLTYSWIFISKPDGSDAIIPNSTIVNPEFAADIDGEYIISLVVNDGIEDSTTDTVTIIASSNTAIIFVDASNNSGIEDGSQTYPYNTIQEGIDVTNYGDIVEVAIGEYYENIIMVEGIIIRGEDANNTYIIGDGQKISDSLSLWAVIWVADNSTLERFTIMNNPPENSYNHYLIQSYASDRNDPIIINNIFKDSSGNSGISLWGGTAIIINNTFVNNNFKYSVISTNNYVRSGTPVIKNNIFSNNTMDNLGGVIIGAINEAAPSVSYNIFWNNNVVDFVDFSSGSANLTVNPKFVDPSNSNYHISSDSPAIDTGDNTNAPAKDFEGDLRPIDGNNDNIDTVDIGADEFR